MRANQEQREFWNRHVAAFEKSGMKRKDYCRENGLKLHQLDYWRRKLQSKAMVSANGHREGWIRLDIRDEGAVKGASGIRLRIGRATIELDSGFDPSLLAEVLRVAGAVC